MSLSWSHRKTRLAELLRSQGDEDADGLALDRLLHGQNVIGKTSRTTEIDSLRFQDKDLNLVGTLDYGQFGVIDVVTCRLDNRVYVRKSIEKRFALRTRDQCFPLFERNILLQARRTNAEWAPHLLCAFQTPTHLKIIMDYAEGGTLWDVLESSPHDGRIPEKDLLWWTPQIVSSIHWCHSQGFVHRDIKPHNFVLTPDAHVLLIDFGSAAPLLSPAPDGSRKLPKRYCLVPCGTCDYISPEILNAHEEALVALEMDDEDDTNAPGSTSKRRAAEATEGYGLETDWWSLGAMLYELAYGVAPFFASDIRQTYLRIINHEKSLQFDKFKLSTEYQDFLTRLLVHAEARLGRRTVTEITGHPVFRGVDWPNLKSRKAPLDLHLPQFEYAEPPANVQPNESAALSDESLSNGFSFSAFFQSSSSGSAYASPGISSIKRKISPARSSFDCESFFIGFSWGPPLHAFTDTTAPRTRNQGAVSNANTSMPIRMTSTQVNQSILSRVGTVQSTPLPTAHRFSTPTRFSSLTPYGTLPRPSTVRRSAPRRTMSDREAMKQLVDCVGMSARKKVLESGRKPRLLTSFSRSTSLSRKELRFVSSPIPLPNYFSSSAGEDVDHDSEMRGPAGLSVSIPNTDPHAIFSGTEDTESEGPPSPSPRPGSSMSRRSATPTVSSIMSHRMGINSLSASGGSTMLLHPLLSARSGLGLYNNLRRDTSTVDGVGVDAIDNSSLRRSLDQPGTLHNPDEEIGLMHAENQAERRGDIYPNAEAGPSRRRAMTVSSSAPSVFDELEERHAIIMKDIRDLEQRLSLLLRMV
ncbi:hypothetical protein AMATHDRAFT_6687 [Amanita thiersii Skay4041]|uniref:Protein kinase domain-containing protein n=1 Tax=Amanita thiersii Skay4041 TaxID=703135 RepID=A0A2A9NGX6_9AGAR|nr:hypothetical protein AMATHDRAFT_6687 [Amanita thiersii Skay4041]